MNRILIVEDDESIAAMMRMCLTKHNYACEICNDGISASEKIENNRYDLILLDVMLPGIDGFELIDYIRQYDMPVVFVTAKSAVSDRVRGLKAGADDYIVKPFDLQELVARIETVLRRFHKEERHMAVGKISVDTLSRTVTLNGEPVALSMKEYDLLLYLIRNKNIALYRESIYEQVWNEPYYGNTRTIDLHMQRLKKKLRLGASVETVYKVGYKFCPEKLI